MAEFNKRFKRDDGNSTQAGGGSVAVGEQQHQPPAPDPQTRVAPPGGLTDRDGSRGSSGGNAAVGRTKDHVRGDHDHDGVKDRHEHGTSAREVRARQRDEFGGFNWGSAFFGWLVAIGLGALLTALLSGAGAAVGLTDSGATNSAENNAETVTIAGGIALLVISIIAYYAGGYVAGRMSRFDGARQGFGVWIFGLLVTVAIAAAGWLLGDKYNVLERLDLPRIPVNASDLTTGGLIALAAIVLGTLLAAIAGGKVGQRYHNKVDRAGFGEKV